MKKSKLDLNIKGNITPMLSLIVRLHKHEPEVFMNEAVLKHRMKKDWINIDDKEKCPNCGASMKGYIYEFDYHDVKLLQAMEKQFLQRGSMGYNFTEANKIDTRKIDCSYTAKSKKTQASKLGLIAKLLVGGKHVPSVWVITERGFKALRNMPVPKRVHVKRNKIIDRFDDVITISEILERNKEKFMVSPYYQTDTRSPYYEVTDPIQGELL